jgi:hypothetical protein
MMRYNLYELMGSKTGYIPSKDYSLTFQSKEEHEKYEETALKVGVQLLRQAYPLLDSGNIDYRFVRSVSI